MIAPGVNSGNCRASQPANLDRGEIKWSVLAVVFMSPLSGLIWGFMAIPRVDTRGYNNFIPDGIAGAADGQRH
jgi:hypothetical protein